MHIWWLNLRPTGGTPPDPDETRETQARRAQEFCRKYSVLGMGWRVTPAEGELSWDEYQNRRDERRDEDGRYDRGGNVNRWKEKVSIGDLVWTKTEDDRFWLARITGDWHYDSSVAAKKADIVNQRPAMIVEIGGRADVPERVAKGGRHAVEEIHAPEKMGEVDVPIEMGKVADAVRRYPNLLPRNLVDYCALWKPLRGTGQK